MTQQPNFEVHHRPNTRHSHSIIARTHPYVVAEKGQKRELARFVSHREADAAARTCNTIDELKQNAKERPYRD